MKINGFQFSALTSAHNKEIHSKIEEQDAEANLRVLCSSNEQFVEITSNCHWSKYGKVGNLLAVGMPFDELINCVKEGILPDAEGWLKLKR